MSACVAGAVPRAIIKGDMKKAEELVKKYKEVFKDDYYLEIQNHGIAEEQMAMQGILQLARKHQIKLTRCAT